MERPLTPTTLPDALAPASRDIRAVVFDTDGVITDSARVVDGKSLPQPPAGGTPVAALDGAAAFLASRGIEASDETVRDVAADKERLFTERLRTHGVDAYPGTVRLVRALRGAGVPSRGPTCSSRRSTSSASLPAVPLSWRTPWPEWRPGAAAGSRVVGVDRAAAEGSGERLRRHGADILVRDLAELLAQGASK